MRNSIPYLSPSGHFGPFDLLGDISRRDRFNQRADRPFFVSQSTLFDWQSGPIEQGEADASQHGRDKGEADCAAQRYQLRTASQNPTDKHGHVHAQTDGPDEPVSPGHDRVVDDTYSTGLHAWLRRA